MVKPLSAQEKRLWRIKELLWHRRQLLECMTIALRAFNRFDDRRFYEYAQQFGARAADLRRDCEVLQRED